MSKTTEHGKIIAAVAKAALAPIGCIRKGQSRTWYSDQRYWLIAVEFQPSGWAKGTYLNIFVGWLWKESPGYDIAYRLTDFVQFETAEQFTPEVVRMAEIGAREVEKQRELFCTFDRIYDYLLRNSHRSDWCKYHAAVAAGLARDIRTARRLFEELAAWKTDGYEWQEQLKKTSGSLAALLGSPTGFRGRVLDIIDKTRELKRLPANQQCVGILDSIKQP